MQSSLPKRVPCNKGTSLIQMHHHNIPTRQEYSLLGICKQINTPWYRFPSHNGSLKKGEKWSAPEHGHLQCFPYDADTSICSQVQTPGKGNTFALKATGSHLLDKRYCCKKQSPLCRQHECQGCVRTGEGEAQPHCFAQGLGMLSHMLRRGRGLNSPPQLKTGLFMSLLT